MVDFLQPLINALLAQTPEAAQAAWKDGPTPLGSRATVQVPVAQYIAWVVAVEKGLADRTPTEIIRRVRRMHYSNFSVKPDSTTSQSIDELLDETSDNPDSQPPLTTAQVSQAVINGLYSTSAVLTAAGNVVDITHVLNIIDFAVNGRTLYSRVEEAGTFAIPGYSTATDELVSASLGWLGDLGSIWFEWMTRRGASRAQPATLTGAERTSFEAALTGRCPLDDLLGDIDGAVMAKLPGLSQQPLSYTLTSYYANEASTAALTAPSMNSRQRLHYFVANSVPFVHTTQPGPPLRATVDAANAAMIVDLLKNLASIIWHGFANLADADPATHDPIFLEIANRFLKWLQDGLADANGGVPAWPPAPTALPS